MSLPNRSRKMLRSPCAAGFRAAFRSDSGEEIFCSGARANVTHASHLERCAASRLPPPPAESHFFPIYLMAAASGAWSTAAQAAGSFGR